VPGTCAALCQVPFTLLTMNFDGSVPLAAHLADHEHLKVPGAVGVVPAGAAVARRGADNDWTCALPPLLRVAVPGTCRAVCQVPPAAAWTAPGICVAAVARLIPSASSAHTVAVIVTMIDAMRPVAGTLSLSPLPEVRARSAQAIIGAFHQKLYPRGPERPQQRLADDRPFAVQPYSAALVVEVAEAEGDPAASLT
jgi:hypothetical protein